jgi:4-hydroxy-tetrahydrodipicolinate synthase
MLQGLITAIPTPFNKYGIDYTSVSKLVQFQLDNGVDGLVILGSTGEGSALCIAEKIALVEDIIAHVASRVKIIIGVPNYNFEDTCTFIEIFNRITGVDYFMISPPAYVKPTQEGLYQYFEQISMMSCKPIILYNVPSRSACDLLDDTVISLAKKFNNIVGLKDATGNIARLCYLNKYKPNGFSLLSGDDETAMSFILSGGNGVISVTSNIKPLEMSKMIKSALNMDNKIAIEYNNQLIAIYRAMFLETNPMAVKWALCYKQIIENCYLRLPLVSLDDKYHEQLKLVLQ